MKVRVFIMCFCSLLSMSFALTATAENVQPTKTNQQNDSLNLSPTPLPSIGEGASAASKAEEKRLGQAWLRYFRGRVPTSSDPQLIEYTEDLLDHLSQFNPAAGDELSLVIVENRNINAFAVPGGVIGVNTGLYAYAESEAQFASVLAHELAHLSQRHYARGLEQQKGQAIFNTAALLGSILIAAAGNGEAGIAALQATQAGMIDRQLRFSRDFEQEADRIGMDTLIDAGFNPHSMADMFEQIQRSTRFSAKPPEFLLTHPVTAKRIADAENRARSHPSNTPTSSLNYDLMRARVLLASESTPQQAISRFESELKGFSASKTGTRYGLALAHIAAKEFNTAQQLITQLLELHPDNKALVIAQSDIDVGSQQLSKAINLIQRALIETPDSYSLNMQLSRLFAANNAYKKSVLVLTQLSLKRSSDVSIWFNLAEYAGLAGDILALHKARTEFFLLRADFDSAENQVNNIIKKFGNNTTELAEAKQRLINIKKLRENSKI
ncbi:MAG: putative Zn-dependent protease [Pseudohongiellaceae bacterium]|jgi:predicted Zn-dependent protease